MDLVKDIEVRYSDTLAILADEFKKTPEFKEFPKIPRLNKEVVVTEKIDGTNACVVVVEKEHGQSFADRQVFAQSRNRIITPTSDNYGFAKWVEENKETLKQLGPGHHYGEWWGKGIQRGYGIGEKLFSLFNVSRWGDARPACCSVVPILGRGMGFNIVEVALNKLKLEGSVASPGFMKPEGVMVFHAGANQYFKAFVENDDLHKYQIA